MLSKNNWIATATLLAAMLATRAYAQESAVDGASAGADPITGTALNTLATASVNLPLTAPTWNCVVTCSAEFGTTVTGATDVDGRLTITSDNIELTGVSRSFELNDNAGINDAEALTVSTTGIRINILNGVHTFACAAAKVVSTDANFTTNDSSVTVACSTHRF